VLVAPIGDLGVEQLDGVAALCQRVAERDERADVTFAAPRLYADAHRYRGPAPMCDMLS
jgi:hypothetical protein